MIPNTVRTMVCCALLALVHRGNAQEVLASSGGLFQNATHTITFTIGEPVIATHSQSVAIATQGFHQPEDDFSTQVAAMSDPAVDVLAWPNPAREEVIVTVIGVAGPVTLEVFDALGRGVQASSAFSERILVDVRTLSSGTYHARITSEGRYLTTVHLSITR